MLKGLSVHVFCNHWKRCAIHFALHMLEYLDAPPLVQGVNRYIEKRNLESDFECDETFEPDRPATA